MRNSLAVMTLGFGIAVTALWIVAIAWLPLEFVASALAGFF